MRDLCPKTNCQKIIFCYRVGVDIKANLELTFIVILAELLLNAERVLDKQIVKVLKGDV